MKKLAFKAGIESCVPLSGFSRDEGGASDKDHHTRQSQERGGRAGRVEVTGEQLSKAEREPEGKTGWRRKSLGRQVGVDWGPRGDSPCPSVAQPSLRRGQLKMLEYSRNSEPKVWGRRDVELSLRAGNSGLRASRTAFGFFQRRHVLG